MSIVGMCRVMIDIEDERDRQDAKWGEQNHPDGTGGFLLYGDTDVNLDMRTAEELARIFRRRCDTYASQGKVTFRDILLEEVFEAFAESDPARLREELIQVAAVAAAWVEAIDRRS